MNSRNLLNTVFSVLLTIGFIIGFGQPQGDTVALSESDPGWSNAQSLPNEDRVARYGHAQCPEDPDSFYVVSGFGKDYTTATNKVWRYDANLNVWSPLADIPTGQGGLTTVCYDGKIYALGGGPSNQFYIYNIYTNEWVSGPPLPRNVWGAAAGAYGGFIYLIGGDDSGVSNQVNIYDITAGAWVGTGTPIPIAAGMQGFAQAGKYLYLVGGFGAASPGQNLNKTLRYNMKTNSWEEGPTFTSSRADLALAITETYLYAIGGDIEGGGFIDATTLVEKLDHTTWPVGSWQAAVPLPEALTAYPGGFCTEAIDGGEVWSVAGYTGEHVVRWNRYLPAEACFLEFEPALSGAPLAKPGAPDTIVSYLLSIENLGSVKDTFSLSLEGNAWVTTISQAEVTLTAGSGAQITVQVTVPEIAAEGNSDTVTVKAVSNGDPTKEASVSLTTTATWKPVAGFQASATSVLVGDLITFTNTTVGIDPISYLWDFDDGNTSTDENPTHAFNDEGLYTVKLTATNIHGADSFEMTIEVTFPVEVDLAIVLNVSPAQVQPGQIMTLTIKVMNLSEDQATGVITTGQIPEFVQVVDISEGCSLTAPTLICNYGAIDGGASKTAWVKAIFTRAGAFEFAQTVAANEDDPQMSNNTSTLNLQIYHKIFMPIVVLP
jgi:uncharacterized repeat protein (TIGR01451 family)